MEELQVPLDREGFSRRECPGCHAAFKTRWGAREAGVIAAALSARMHDLVGGERSPVRTCPYCALEAPADRFFPRELQQQLEREANRFDHAVRAHRLSVPAEWVASNPRATPPPTASGDLPAPPVHAEPVGDLVRIALPCCGEEQKVTDAWVGPIRCHVCGIAHLRAGPRDFGLELALLRHWSQQK